MPDTNGHEEAPRPDRQLERVERQRQALQLRQAGVEYDDIARELGYADRSGAWKAVQAALNASVKEPAQKVRELELKRLDRLLRVAYRMALGSPARVENGVVVELAVAPSLAALDRCLKLMERRSALLGLDAPIRRRIDLITHDAFAEAMEQLEAEIVRLDAETEDVEEVEA